MVYKDSWKEMNEIEIQLIKMPKLIFPKLYSLFLFFSPVFYVLCVWWELFEFEQIFIFYFISISDIINTSIPIIFSLSLWFSSLLILILIAYHWEEDNNNKIFNLWSLWTRRKIFDEISEWNKLKLNFILKITIH